MNLRISPLWSDTTINVYSGSDTISIELDRLGQRQSVMFTAEEGEALAAALAASCRAIREGRAAARRPRMPAAPLMQAGYNDGTLCDRCHERQSLFERSAQRDGRSVVEHLCGPCLRGGTTAEPEGT